MVMVIGIVSYTKIDVSAVAMNFLGVRFCKGLHRGVTFFGRATGGSYQLYGALPAKTTRAFASVA